jgi:hypothetical protein
VQGHEGVERPESVPAAVPGRSEHGCMIKMVSPNSQGVEVRVGRAGELVLSLARGVVRRQERAVEAAVEHLRHVRGRAGEVQLDTAELLVPQLLALRLDVLERRRADLLVDVRARLGGRDERDADAELDLARGAEERDERARLVLAADEVLRHVEGRHAERTRVVLVPARLSVLGTNDSRERTYASPCQTPYSSRVCFPPLVRS